RDMAGNPHVLSVGIDLAPVLDANGTNSAEIIASITADCLRRRSDAPMPRIAASALRAAAGVLNIARLASSARAARTARGRIAVKGPFPRARARSPTFARKSWAQRARTDEQGS